MDYERPILTVDVVLVTLLEGRLKVALMRRQAAPFEGAWALPGGFIHTNADESPEATALRVLKEKVNFKPSHIEQVTTVGNHTRDPRGWAASIVYLALENRLMLQAQIKQGVLELHDLDSLPVLAFDHDKLIKLVIDRLRSRSSYSSIAAHLLPATFTLPQLQTVYEMILRQPLNKANFRRKMFETKTVEEIEGLSPSSGRPAQLYRLTNPIQNFERQI